MENGSLSDRKRKFLEDCCGGGAPTMSMGDAGFQSASPAEGPTAGYDPTLGGDKKKKKLMDTVKKLRKG